MSKRNGTRTDSVTVFDGATADRATIGCVIPARDAAASIARVIAALLGQTRVPDFIHVVVSNTTDDTVDAASAFAGPHRIITDLGEQFTEVFVHDIGRNSEGRPGALNYGYWLVEGCDYLLGVDGDAICDERAVERLEAETVRDSRVDGQISMFSTAALRAGMEAGHQRAPWACEG